MSNLNTSQDEVIEVLDTSDLENLEATSKPVGCSCSCGGAGAGAGG